VTVVVAAVGSAVVESRPVPEGSLSALPSPAARVAAFAAICLAGLAGALIGYSLVELQCEGDCALPLGLGLFVGAVVAAGGMSVVAVLVLRALGEWRELQDRTP
jgi:hypothetical protein